MSVSATGQATSAGSSEIQALRRQMAQASARLARLGSKLQEVQRSTTLNAADKQSQTGQLQMQMQLTSQLLAQLSAQLASRQSQSAQAAARSERSASALAARRNRAEAAGVWGEIQGALLDTTA